MILFIKYYHKIKKNVKLMIKTRTNSFLNVNEQTWNVIFFDCLISKIKRKNLHNLLQKYTKLVFNLNTTEVENIKHVS